MLAFISHEERVRLLLKGKGSEIELKKRYAAAP